MIFEDVKKNKRASSFIVAIFVLVIMIGVYSICMYYNLGVISVFIALVFSIIPAMISYYNCDKMILVLNGARPATKEQDNQLTVILDNLCIASGLPRPKLYVIEDSAPNAFATGRDPEHAALCFTTGLLEKLDKYELEGVMAHELSHVKNYDIRLSTFISVFVGFVVILSDFMIRTSFRRSGGDNNKGSGIFAIIAIIFMILSPIFAVFMQLAISRKREYLADGSAIEMTRNPNGLISALKKISEDTEPLEAANKSTAHMYIVNPFQDKRKNVKDSLMSTHPAIENRIAALEGIK